MRKKKLSLILFVLLLLWVAVIFFFSSQPPGVSNQQSRLVVQLMEGINDIFDISDTKFYAGMERAFQKIWFIKEYKTPNAVVRKSAHFGIYFLLGAIAAGFAYVYSQKLFIGFLLGNSLPVMIAVLDEFNQGLVGRTSSIDDVIIDGTGAFSGSLIAILLIGLFKIITFWRRR